MTISQERINKLCDKENLTISFVEKKLGFSNGYINQERKREFPADRLAAIAKILSTTTEYLTGKTNNSFGSDAYLYDTVHDLPDNIQQIIGILMRLNEKGQAKALSYAEDLLATGHYLEDTPSTQSSLKEA